MARDQAYDPGEERSGEKQRRRLAILQRKFKVGDHLTWNSEVGQVSGTIIKVHTTDVDCKEYTHHANADDPQKDQK